MDTTEYRKKLGSDIFHFCPKCKQYPTKNFYSYSNKPSGEACDECLRKQKSGSCD